MTSEIESRSGYAHVAQVVDTRFYKYLVSRKSAIKDEELIDGLFDEEKLAIEVQAQERRDEKKQQSEELLQRLSKNLRPHYANHMRKRLEDIEHITKSLIQFPEHIEDILDVTYPQSATIKSIAGVVGAENTLTRKILQTVNNRNFRKSIGRLDDARKIDKLHSAISYIGFDGFQALLLFLMFKNCIKPYNQLFSGMYDKIWKHCVGSSICANFLLREKRNSAQTEREKNRINPFEGYVMAFMANVGIIAIYYQCFETYEEVKI